MILPDRRSGLLLVISSPSGAGKTTLARRLAGEFELHFSVSYTRASPRKDEVQGKDYHFVSRERFAQMVEGHEFAEMGDGAWQPVRNQHGDGETARLPTGWTACSTSTNQGGRQIRRPVAAESVLCFILPPSMGELERRLRQRATDSNRRHRAPASHRPRGAHPLR